MADIRTYLDELEARLAPTHDAGALQERLTEAENHLRDRALEFEEIGLPSGEAEARAVAAFGRPEEYTDGLPMRTLPPVPRETPKPSRDLALQLAWSVAGIGIVAMALQSYAAETAGGVIVAIFGFGALFGRASDLRKVGLLAAVASFAGFLVMTGFYDPKPSNGYRTERIGVRLRGTPSDAEYAYRQAVQNQERFGRAFEEYLHRGSVKDSISRRGGYVGPAATIPEDYWGWQGDNVYPYALSVDILQTYGTRDEAVRAWERNGSALADRLREVVAKSKPIDPGLSDAELTVRFALVALLGGILLFASSVGVQALALMLRALFGGIGRLLPPSGDTTGLRLAHRAKDQVTPV